MPRMTYAGLASTTALTTLMSLGMAQADPTVGHLTDLGTLGGNVSRAFVISADGSVIVGVADDTSGGQHAALWANGSTTATDLGTLGGDNSSAEAISGINSVIIGYAATSIGPNHAVSWDVRGAITDLGTLDGGKNSYATAVNQAGSVIVGQAQTDSDFHSHAVVWVDGATRPTDLGTLGGINSYADGVSADGTVIVGQAMTKFGDGDYHAASWVNGSTTATDLGTLGGNRSRAYAVSADGSLIVGSADTDTGYSRAFIVKLTFPIQDNQNLIDSFGGLANDTAVAVAGQQVALGGLLATDCVAIAGASSCFSASGTLLRTGANGDMGSQGAGLSQISAGHAVSPSLTAGASLALGHVQQTGSALGDSTQTAVSLWSNYSQNGSFGTGLMAHAAIGTARGTETINRGVGFDNVVVSTGTADLTSSAVQASLSYGVQAKDGWRLTPMAGLTWMETRRAAYSETTGVFPASFDTLTTRSSYATLGLSAQRPIDARSNLSLGAGADMDLSADHGSLSGTSDLPGMTSFTVTDSLSRHKMRPYVVAGYSYSLSAQAMLGASLQVAAPVYGTVPEVNLGVKYVMSF